MGNELKDSNTLNEMLKGCLLFSDADDAAIDLVAKSLRPMEIKKGDPVILEGEIGEDVFFIKSGTIEIVKYRHELHQVSRVAILKAGTHFSEFSVLNRANKSASAFALEDSILYRINGETFLKILEDVPVIGQRLIKTLAELNFNSSASSSLEYFDPVSIAYNPEIPNLFPAPLWKKFGVLPLQFYPGILLVAAKDPNKTEFFNHCKVAMRDLQINVVLIAENDFEQTLKRLTRLYNDGARESKVSPNFALDVEIDAKSCIRQSPYFLGVAEDSLDQLVALFEEIEVESGQAVFKPDAAPEFFYVVQSGQVELSRPTKNNQAWTRLRLRRSGEGLAEVPLLMGHPHSHLARAIEPTRLLRMPKSTFDQLLTSGIFCLNLAKILALRLQSYTETAALKFYDGEKPLQLQELSNLIPRQLMNQHQVIPLRLEDKEITLGIVNTENEAIYSIICRYLRGYRINVELITLENFKNWTVKSDSGLSQVIPIRKNAENTVLELNKLLIDGFENRASDLHFEPTGSGYCIRYRIDGVLSEIASQIPTEVGQTMVSRIKVLSDLDISNRMVPQDGQMKVTEAGVEMLARVATVPTKQGEGAVLRLIRGRTSAVPLTMLAPDSRTVKTLKQIARFKQGLFLVTGPTGSGKTTTLYSLIGELNRVDVKIISLEDPVELEIPGITQIEINERTGLTFDKALRGTLRQDPDVLMVGEIRDAKSAKAVFEAALSGHLVISTLHTTNSFSVKNRLKELGVPLGTMATGLVGSMAQRLVRSVCKKCRAHRPLTNLEKSLLSSRLHLTQLPGYLWEGKGCIVCHQSGYHGRLPIMEVWCKNPTIEQLISQDGSTEQLLEAARPDGFDTLYEFGLRMAINGLTTVEEVDRTMAGGW